MTCVHFLLTKARDKNVYSLKLIREKSSRLSTETDIVYVPKKRKKYPWILTDAIIAQRANWSLDCSKLSPKLPMIN